MTILFTKEAFDSIYTILFNLESQQKIAKLIVQYIKLKKFISKSQLSQFADKLNDAALNELGEDYFKLKESMEFDISELKYNKKQFYSRIIGPLKEMGLINLGIYDKKYRLGTEFLQNLETIANMWSKEINL